MAMLTSHARSTYRQTNRLPPALIAVALYAGCHRNPCPPETRASVRENRCVALEGDAAVVDPADGEDGDATFAEPLIDAGDDRDDEAGASPDGADFEEGGVAPPDDAGSAADGGLAGDGGRAVFSPLPSPWQLIAGSASMVAVGANGDVWSLGTALVSNRGKGVFKRVGEDWIEVPSDGAENLAVDPNGAPWIVDGDGTLFRGSDSSAHPSWTLLAGPAIVDVTLGVADLAFGAQGAMWILGRNQQTYYLTVLGAFADTGDANRMAQRLAVAPNGVPWIIDSIERVFERTSSSTREAEWTFHHGTGAADISIAPDGAVFILGDTLAATGGRLTKYLSADQAWVPLDETLGAISIAAGPNDVWLVDSQKRIHRAKRAELR